MLKALAFKFGVIKCEAFDVKFKFLCFHANNTNFPKKAFCT